MDLPIKTTDLNSIIAENRDLLHRMRQLNKRAGWEMFRLPTQAEVVAHFVAGLRGARRTVDVTDPSVLRLPALDEAVVSSLLAQCPDSISVLGETITVEYDDGYGGVAPNPRVKLSPALTAKNRWLDLPDEGVTLPNGRKVAVVITLDGFRGEWVSGTDIVLLKEKARKLLNQGSFDRWRQPTLPDPTNTIAPVVEYEYGRCAITGAPLVAYGVVKRSWSRWYTHWTTDRAEAEREYTEACRRFAELQEEARRIPLKKQISQLYYGHRHMLPVDLCERLYRVAQGFHAVTSTEMEALVAETFEVVKPPAQVADTTTVDMTQLFGGAARVVGRSR